MEIVTPPHSESLIFKHLKLLGHSILTSFMSGIEKNVCRSIHPKLSFACWQKRSKANSSGVVFKFWFLRIGKK